MGLIPSLPALANYNTLYLHYVERFAPNNLLRIAPQLRRVDIGGPADWFIFSTDQFVEIITNLTRRFTKFFKSFFLLSLSGFSGVMQITMLEMCVPTTPFKLLLTILDLELYSPFYELLFDKMIISAIGELSLDIDDTEIFIRPISSGLTVQFSTRSNLTFQASF